MKQDLDPSSFHSPEPTTSTSRRGRASSAQKERKENKLKQQQQQQLSTPPTDKANGGGAPPVPPASVGGSPAEAAPAGQQQQQQEEQQQGGAGGGVPTTCNCKKSKCLKLYCECFQRRQYCSDCNCHECLNTERTEDLRQVAIQGTIERNPQAFTSKFEKRAGKRSHNAGCNCKKSACLKKYCECFQAAVSCGTNCKCTNCKNYEGAAGGRKRRVTEAALVQLPPRTPTRMSARGRTAVPLTDDGKALIGGSPGLSASAVSVWTIYVFVCVFRFCVF